MGLSIGNVLAYRRMGSLAHSPVFQKGINALSLHLLDIHPALGPKSKGSDEGG